MKLTSLATAAVLALSVGTAGAANLLADGDFEAFDPLVANGGYFTVNAPSTLGLWTVGGISVDLIQNNYGAITNVSVDLAGTPGPGSLSQGFMAQAGYIYTLTFDVSNNGGTQLGVTLGGNSSTYNVTFAASYSLVWNAAVAGSQLVKFDSLNGGNGGPVIDNVMLTAVPEPGTYAMLLAGLAAVGFVAKRRRA